MRIELDADSIYHFLCNPLLPPNLALCDDGRVVVAGENEFYRANIYGGNFASPGEGANLQEPFVKASVQLRRVGMQYSGGIGLTTDFPSVSNSPLWSVLARGLRQKYPTQFVGVRMGGYIIDPKTRVPHIAIDAAGKMLTLYTGTEGCPVRQLDKLESFRPVMNSIAEVTNSILDIAIPAESRQDITLFLSI